MTLYNPLLLRVVCAYSHDSNEETTAEGIEKGFPRLGYKGMWLLSWMSFLPLSPSSLPLEEANYHVASSPTESAICQ